MTKQALSDMQKELMEAYQGDESTQFYILHLSDEELSAFYHNTLFRKDGYNLYE